MYHQHCALQTIYWTNWGCSWRNCFRAYSSFQASWILFEGQEFAWTDSDSAYPLGEWVIPVHKMPASNLCHIDLDKAVSHIRVRSEHTWELWRMLSVSSWVACEYKFTRRPYQSLRWITCAIILHNLIIDVEGEVSGAHFQPLHRHIEEEEILGLLVKRRMKNSDNESRLR